MSPTEWRVALTIAGSDSGGGAGIQADLKTFAAHGVFGMSAVTAVTAQNSLGVHRVDPIPPAGLEAQLRAVFDDFPVHVVKIGMLATADHAAAVARVFSTLRPCPPVILDPVMVASTGHRLLSDDAVARVRDLLAQATLATPNRQEAAVLADGDPDWLFRTQASILVTGGDDLGTVEDTWWHAGGIRRIWSGPRIGTRSFHGTGCTLASAVAARVALGHPLEEAIDGAIRWVRSLVAHAEATGALGTGNPTLAHHAIPALDATGPHR